MRVVTKSELAAYDAMIAKHRPRIFDLHIELDVDDGSYVEITEFPGERDSDEMESWIDVDWKVMEAFPTIMAELEKHLDFLSQQAANDKAVRRAESGYAD